MKLASIQVITDIRPIEGADRIEAATVLGYQTVIKKGEFRPGDLCVWHEPDTVTADRPEYEFLRSHGFRLKVSPFATPAWWVESGFSYLRMPTSSVTSSLTA